jgi:hypothetical protein
LQQTKTFEYAAYFRALCFWLGINVLSFAQQHSLNGEGLLRVIFVRSTRFNALGMSSYASDSDRIGARGSPSLGVTSRHMRCSKTGGLIARFRDPELSLIKNSAGAPGRSITRAAASPLAPELRFARFR